MSSDIALQVRQLGKQYRIYERPRDRLLQGLWRGRRAYFRPFDALDSVSLTVQRGEALAIIGRNGSGKSTLLQLICGTLTPSSGEVSVNGRLAALLELGAGFDPEYTGRQNVSMNAALLGLSAEETHARLPAILAFADIGDYADQAVKTYSSGMFLRLAFAVIAHVDADILVVDEAMAVGDAFFVQKCMRYLREFKARGTLLLVTHDAAAVTALCDRAVWLDKGRVRGDGPAREVVEAYQAGLYEEQQGESRVPESGQALASEIRPPAFGLGEARIESARLFGDRGRPLHQVSGGEAVTLEVCVRAGELGIARPIIGFLVKDRLGQVLFGTNTCDATHQTRAAGIGPGDAATCRFGFPMPRLAQGDYVVAVAIADGDRFDHVQQHWVHDALKFSSVPSSPPDGLFGIELSSLEVNAY